MEATGKERSFHPTCHPLEHLFLNCPLPLLPYWVNSGEDIFVMEKGVEVGEPGPEVETILLWLCSGELLGV